EQTPQHQREFDYRLTTIRPHRPRARTKRPHHALIRSIGPRQKGRNRAAYKPTAASVVIKRTLRQSHVSSFHRIGATTWVIGSRRSGGTSRGRIVSTTRSPISRLTRP